MGGGDQVYGLDFYETWGPVGHYTTLRCLLVIYACEDLETIHLDMKCAFQNGKLYKAVWQNTTVDVLLHLLDR